MLKASSQNRHLFVAQLADSRLAEKSGRDVPVGRVMCFLDKCCIHQSDEAKKTGIRQLGAFLRQSNSMMVLCVAARIFHAAVVRV